LSPSSTIEGLAQQHETATLYTQVSYGEIMRVHIVTLAAFEVPVIGPTRELLDNIPRVEIRRNPRCFANLGKTK